LIERFAIPVITIAITVRPAQAANTPLYPSTTETLHPTEYHPETTYKKIPDRAKLGCDWPYAVRRYNGSGVNSFHYQYEVLRRLTRPPLTA